MAKGEAPIDYSLYNVTRWWQCIFMTKHHHGTVAAKGADLTIRPTQPQRQAIQEAMKWKDIESRD